MTDLSAPWEETSSGMSSEVFSADFAVIELCGTTSFSLATGDGGRVSCSLRDGN